MAKLPFDVTAHRWEVAMSELSDDELFEAFRKLNPAPPEEYGPLAPAEAERMADQLIRSAQRRRWSWHARIRRHTERYHNQTEC